MAVTEFADLLTSVSWEPPGAAELVTSKIGLLGLKKVIRLEVKDADDTVTFVARSERPGTPNGPLLTQMSPATSRHSPSAAHDFRVTQSAPRTT